MKSSVIYNPVSKKYIKTFNGTNLPNPVLSMWFKYAYTLTDNIEDAMKFTAPEATQYQKYFDERPIKGGAYKVYAISELKDNTVIKKIEIDATCDNQSPASLPLQVIYDAFLAGKKIQYKTKTGNSWMDWSTSTNLNNCAILLGATSQDWRLKPDTITKEVTYPIPLTREEVNKKSLIYIYIPNIYGSGPIDPSGNPKKYFKSDTVTYAAKIAIKTGLAYDTESKAEARYDAIVS
jgi:hypothetical protein